MGTTQAISYSTLALFEFSFVYNLPIITTSISNTSPSNLSADKTYIHMQYSKPKSRIASLHTIIHTTSILRINPSRPPNYEINLDVSRNDCLKNKKKRTKTSPQPKQELYAISKTLVTSSLRLILVLQQSCQPRLNPNQTIKDPSPNYHFVRSCVSPKSPF